MNDHELLRAYAVDGSHKAFAQLVERHLSLVWSTAHRQMGDGHLAQDVAQQVFVLLARKSNTLSSDIIVSGWLYRTTVNLAADTLRGDHRRRQREQSAAITMNEPHSDPNWLQIKPMLDEAMADLNERDRDAIVLRYFENQSLHDVGIALGATEDAAQKRLTRAVEKLRAFFEKRGKVISNSTILAAIAAGVIQPVPATMAAAISTAVLSAVAMTTPTAVLTTVKIMTTSILKPFLATGLAVTAAVAIYVEHDRAGRLAVENEALRVQVQKAEAATAELAGQVQTPARERQGEAPQVELLRLRGEVTRLRKSEAEMTRARQLEMVKAQEQAARQSHNAGEIQSMARAQLQTQEAIQLNTIANNLRVIEGAKEQWALENRKTVNDTVSLANLTVYFKNNTLPAALAGETYSVATVGTLAQAILAGPLNGRTGPLTTTSF